MLNYLLIVYTTCQLGTAFCAIQPTRLFTTYDACHREQLKQPYVAVCLKVEIENGE